MNKQPQLDEARLRSVLEDLVFSHPEIEAICKPGLNLRPEGDDQVVFMLDADGAAHELGRVPVSWVVR